MKSIASIVVGLLALGGIGFWLGHNQETKAAVVAAASRPLPVTVRVEPVRAQALSGESEYVGTSTFWREIVMTATTQGIVQTLNIRLNGSVGVGQTLLTVDAEVNRAALTVAEATLQKTRQDLTRYESLHRDNNATVTEVETARLQVQNAELQLTTLRKQVSESVVRAPIGGIVTEKPVERGMYIAPGTPLATITDVSDIKVTVHVPENELTGWPVGRAVPVQFEAYPDARFRGTVHHIGLKSTDGNTASTGRFPVEIRVRNNRAGQPLRVGMTARVVRTDTRATAALTIPRMALVQSTGKPAVYTFSNGRVQLRPIEPGETVGINLVVKQGLTVNEQIVVSGTTGLRDGMVVNSEK